MGARLAEAAEAVIDELRRAERHPEANRHVARADELLARAHAQAEAHRSRLSVLGLQPEARPARAGPGRRPGGASA